MLTKYRKYLLEAKIYICAPRNGDHALPSKNMNRIAYLKSIIEESPGDPFPYFALAKEFEKIPDLKLAREKYEYLCLHHPSYVGTYYHLGKLLERLDLISEALERYDQGIAVAEAQQDLHSKAELQSARQMIDL